VGNPSYKKHDSTKFFEKLIFLQIPGLLTSGSKDGSPTNKPASDIVSNSGQNLERDKY
jgi:hypothetical protein